MEKLTDKQFEYLKSLKTKIVGKLPVCKKNKCDGGHTFDKVTEKISRCDCMKILLYITALISSRIPKDYWALSFDTLQVEDGARDLVEKYMKNIDTAISEGLGILFTGKQRGIGKTSLICEISKKAIRDRYEVYYVIAQEIVDDTFSEETNIVERMKNADLVIIDEFDKVVMKTKSNIPRMLENLLRGMLPNHKAILIGTNMEAKELEENFSIIDLIKRYLKILPMTGESFSNEKQSSWDKKLSKKEIDYLHENILKDAIEWDSNQSIADERRYKELAGGINGQ